MFYGEIPTGFVIMSSCDPVYLRAHAPAWIASCALAGNNAHLHIINPSDDDLAFAYTLRLRAKKLNTDFVMTITADDTKQHLEPEALRTYYACNRFLFARDMLNHANVSMLITDVDCLLMRRVYEPKADFGIFLREPLPGTVGWEREGSRVAAGAVYYSKQVPGIAEAVAQLIDSNDLRWFLDQAALSAVYNSVKDKVKMHYFDSTFLDWEFVEGTNIWTGKGPRKYDNPTYVAKKEWFANQLPDMEQVIWSKF